jgi:hypothetical protein
MQTCGLSGLHSFAPNRVLRNVTAASSPICSQRIGERKAIAWKFAISSQRAPHPRKRVAQNRTPCHDQATHHRDHPHGPGLLRHRTAAGERQDLFRSSGDRECNSWLHFPYQRGDVLQCELAPFSGAKPHIEDRVSTHGFQKESRVPEQEVVTYLRKAEIAGSLPELFGCALHENRNGSGLHAMPPEPNRSICGSETKNLRLELCANELRATLVLSSGEVLRDLPVVDRDWRDFIEAALVEGRGANRVARLERFLNSQFHYKVLSCPHHFIRLGLTRPYHDLCWLMLDTLFPLPKKEWLEEF